MARAGITYQDVANAAQRVRQRGDEPTVDRVRSELGTGSRSTLGPMLKRWKTGSEAAADLNGLPADLVAAVKGLHERAQSAADERIAQEREAHQALEQQWRTELEEVRQRCLTLDGQCNELGKVNEALQTENRIQAEVLQKEQQRTASLATKLDACQDKLSDAGAAAQEMRQENRDIRSHFEHYQQQIAEDRRQERDQFHAVQSGLESQVGRLTQQLSSSEQAQDTLRQHLDQMGRRYEASQDHAKDLNERLHESQSVAAQQQARIETLAETVKRLKQERTGDTQQREGLQSDLNEAEKKLAACEQRIIHLNEQYTTAIDRSRLLGDENRDLMQEKAMLQGQLKQLQRSLTK
ncbi:DNA-binding protein [Marinobacter shengliensis]|uniref:DNA-binding protein n=1 Tax=Marinobacter TaxID=2742 RepID=UPI001E2A8AA8|nr:DNA-binding protein [Marinobacter shengliensis]MCD1632108.1 DNA-binding protein [Marinobacter shengliensis]